MQGIKQRTSKLFYQFSLEEAVPADHPYRRIDKALDLRFLYRRTRSYYGKDGQQSIDPVVFFKLCLLGYFNNITSDRSLVRYCTDSLAARWFLGYDIDEPLPVHSTLSRTRSLFGLMLYEEIFRVVLELCVEAGMVAGKRQVVDSVLVKANASIDSMQRRVIMEDASAWCRQVSVENLEAPEDVLQVSDGDEETGGLTSVELPEEQKPRPRSNKTHRSATDPDARLARKPGKPTDMYYHGQLSVDGQHGVIVAAMADYADTEDHRSLPELLKKIQGNLSAHKLRIEQLLADSKYNTSHTIAACEQADITAFMPNPSGYKPEREGFVYDPVANHYRCSQGVILSYRGQQKRGDYYNNIYSSLTKDCAQCPIRSKCLSKKATYKALYHSSQKAFYDRMADRLQTTYGRRMLGKRKGIVEPVIGSLIHHNAMKKVYARGITAAGKHVLMASLCFNLKKWLKYGITKPLQKAASMEKDRTCSVFDPISLVIGTMVSRRSAFAVIPVI